VADLPGAGTPFQPFRALQLDWEPRGHAPAGVYDDPHFDFHAYYTPRDAVDAIAVGPCSRTGFLSPPAWRAALRPVPAPCFPSGPWASTAQAVAGMGSHLVNLLAPELDLGHVGHGFGQTFILGAYDGRITFVEMMASARWLAANAANGSAALCYPVVGAPSRYFYGGYKPHRYCFEPDAAAGVTTVRFTDLLWFDADEVGCDPDAAGVRFHPDSYAPPLQEAYALNPECVYDVRPLGLGGRAADGVVAVLEAADAARRPPGDYKIMATAPVGVAAERTQGGNTSRRAAVAGMLVAAVGR